LGLFLELALALAWGPEVKEELAGTAWPGAGTREDALEREAGCPEPRQEPSEDRAGEIFCGSDRCQLSFMEGLQEGEYLAVCREQAPHLRQQL